MKEKKDELDIIDYLYKINAIKRKKMTEKERAEVVYQTQICFPDGGMKAIDFALCLSVSILSRIS